MQRAGADAVAVVATEVPAVGIDTVRQVVTAVGPAVATAVVPAAAPAGIAEHELTTWTLAMVLEMAEQVEAD